MVFSLLLVIAAGSNPVAAQGTDTVLPSDESDRIAILHLKGRSAELTEHGVNLRLDFSQAGLPDIIDDRYPLENRSLERDFRVDHMAFCEAFNRNYAGLEATAVHLRKVVCRYSHDVELGQITPVFKIEIAMRAPSGTGLVVVKSVGFGKRYNEFFVSAQSRRKLMLESAAIAYQEALFRCVLAIQENGLNKPAANHSSEPTPGAVY